MNKAEILPLNLKYLAVACGRSDSDVGALIKGLLSYIKEGKKQTFDKEGIRVLYQLFVNDIDDLVASKAKQSETNSCNAKAKKAIGKAKPKSSTNTTVVAEAKASVIDEANAKSSDNDADGNEGTTSTSSDVATDATDTIAFREDIASLKVANEISDLNKSSDNS